MAKSIIYFCDRCGKKYTDKELLPFGDSQVSVLYSDKNSSRHNDLCPICQKALRGWMKYVPKQDDNNTWRKTEDGWFDFYINTKTGEKKFELEDGDILVE